MQETTDFKYDVFISHSSKDKSVPRAIAKRLRDDGLRVWFDEWELKGDDSDPAKIEDGLEHSRVLVLCMSKNAFGSDWAKLEAGTFRFRDPLNKDRRFIPLRLDKAHIPGSLGQFMYINWQPKDREREYGKLLEACGVTAKATAVVAPIANGKIVEKTIKLNQRGGISYYAFAPNGKHVLTNADDNTACLWDMETGHCLCVFNGHTSPVLYVGLSADQRHVFSGSRDRTVRMWDVDTGKCLRVFNGHLGTIWSVAWSTNQRRALSGSSDNTIRLWNLATGGCLRSFKGHQGIVFSVVWSADRRRALSGSGDYTMRLWDIGTGRCLRVFEGHSNTIRGVVWSADQRRALSGSWDKTIRLWDVENGICLRVLEGHSSAVRRLALSADDRHALSGSDDNTVRLWDVETGRCLRVLEGHTCNVWGVAWSADGHHALSGDVKGGIRIWDLSKYITKSRAAKTSIPVDIPAAPDQVQYTNAKVLLVGDTSSGKTGLSMRLASKKWEPSDSTVGAWATHWKLPLGTKDGVEREIWLWDFGGQADQRLIHQLYMDETALAVLVFDGQKEDLFEALGQWDRDLDRAANREFTKLLAAGRIDAGGLRVSRNQVEAFAEERGYTEFLETSAKKNIGCKELKQAILDGIPWEKIPWRSSPLLFKQLKEEIISLKDSGRVLMRFNELRDALNLRLSGKVARFTDEELKAVVSLLAGPCVVWELKFGSWILLQPERINAYAQAVIQTMREDEDERGCLTEERVLNGELTYHSSMERLGDDEERFVLLAMHQTLVERGLCMREQTDCGPLLIFPSFYRRERPELVGHPAVLVSYRFNGFLDDIYATLIVKLHHTRNFDQDELWRYAADFKTTTGKNQQLGVKLNRRAEGAGELEVYFDPAIAAEEKIIFSRYVHEHLLQKAKDVERLRHYVCPHCGTPVGNRVVAMKKLAEGKKDIPCVQCDDPNKRIPLWDQMEKLFASDETKERVRQLQEQSALVLDTESKERVLVGEVISTVALAKQISREKPVSDHGIDMEIEFKNDDGEATGQIVFLQLKSGDSHLRTRKSDGAEIFDIKKPRHAKYWMDQAFPVILIIRNSEGEIRWMEVRDWLQRASNNGKKQIKQIIFEGKRFDVMSIRRWRDQAMGKK
ncbi:MAG: TIR domain-containing protein [candidate division Zixibacteria bacterium]|nr:TIR domain-containing protein [candidate division Zixibacteria bacterium]